MSRSTPASNSSCPRSGSRSRASLARAAAALVICWPLAGSCGSPEQEALRLTAFAPVQIDDRGATAEISAADGFSLDLLVEGWEVTDPVGSSPPEMLMSGRTSRLLFFSPDGSTRSVQALFERPSHDGKLRRLRYCLNGVDLGSLALFPGHPGFRLDFPAGSVRRGRNVLDLAIENERGGGRVAPLQVGKLRFLPLADSDVQPPPAPGRGTVEDLWIPAGGAFEAALEVPAGASIAGRLEASRFAAGEQPLSVRLSLTGDDGAPVPLLDEQLMSGESVGVDATIESWVGQFAALRLEVTGPPGAVIRFRNARLRGAGAAEAQPFGRLARPEPAAASKRLGRPDVVLILLDAARADAFSTFGATRPTPAVDQLAARGTRFSRALSPSSWTGQTIPAVFTGRFPDALGISSWGDSLGSALPTLAEAFSAAGYRTVLWSQHPLYKHREGLTRGFDETLIARKEHRDELPVAEQLLDPERPTFAFVHFLPPHAPYDAPAPFAGRYSSWYRGEFDPDPEILNRYPTKLDPAAVTADDRRFVRDRYHEKVAYADSLVAHVLAALDERGRYDDALVGVLSDHGEGFLEHDRFLHTNQIYTELVHVPLVIKWPAAVSGFRPEVTSTVTLVDLLPTFVDGLGLPVGEAGFQGRSLLPEVFEGAAPERAIYAMTSGVHRPAMPPKRQLRLEWNGWSLVYDPQADRAELYRLDEDPGEARNLASTRPALALLLKQEALMQHIFNRSLLELATEGAGALEPALAKELEALGYL